MAEAVASERSVTRCKCKGMCVRKCPCRTTHNMRCTDECACKGDKCKNREGGAVQTVRRRPRARHGRLPVDVELQHIRELQTQRKQKMEALINKLSMDGMKRLLLEVSERYPAMVLDILDTGSTQEVPPEHTADVPCQSSSSPLSPSPPPTSPPPSSPSSPPEDFGCICGNCRRMDTALEQQCCNLSPEDCLSRNVGMELLVLDAHVITVSLFLRGQYLGYLAEEGVNEGEALNNKNFRYGAYRQFVLWRHGRLRTYDRRIIPSCCVCRIRDRYPEPNGQYVGFRFANLM